tara:strand:- start:26 stop:256 length:231 start_codon:yes stop_codon:yes gene_type:complete
LHWYVLSTYRHCCPNIGPIAVAGLKGLKLTLLAGAVFPKVEGVNAGLVLKANGLLKIGLVLKANGFKAGLTDEVNF